MQGVSKVPDQAVQAHSRRDRSGFHIKFTGSLTDKRVMVFGTAREPAAAVVVVFVLIFAVYLLPTIVAVARKHHQSGAVAAINFFLGWTLIGWVVALAMALSAHRADPVVINQVAGMPGTAPPPGWYPDPGNPERRRYWTGVAWGPEEGPAQAAG